MELNLRKARKLESKIGLSIVSKKGELNDSFPIRVNEDETVIEGLTVTARNNFFLSLKEIEDLIEAKQNIRDLIAKANFAIGIDDAIAQKVLLEAKIGLLNDFTKAEVRDLIAIKDAIALSKKQQEGERSSMYARTTVNAGFLSRIDKDKIIADRIKAQRDIELLDDKLAELNYSTKIKLDANVLKLLQDNSLI